MFFLIVLLLLFSPNNFETDSAQNLQNRIVRKRTFVWAVFSNHTPTQNASFPPKTGSCRWLRGLKHQNKQCRRRKGLSDILLTSRELAVTHCKEQFQYDRWNCTYKRALFKRVYRETAFLYSLATSALTYSIARACSEGKLINCRCASVNKKHDSLHEGWKWGGCGDNVRDASKIARKFLQLGKPGDWPHQVLNYNSEVGINVIAENEIRVCACHGVSASCVLKTCFKRIQPFSKISEKLKERYHQAVKVHPDNKISMTDIVSGKNPERLPKLYYLVQSPNYCHTTVGRRCKDVDNCATLCCGRGFFEMIEEVTRRCNCRWRKCCLNLECDICRDKEIVNVCK